MYSVKKAIEEIYCKTDYQVRDLVFYENFAYLVAAIRLGRRTPPDLAERTSSYCVPQAMPWHPEREQRRSQRLRALVNAPSERWSARN